MDSQETNDENAIRHYKGTVKQFKQMFDDLADGKDTNKTRLRCSPYS